MRLIPSSIWTILARIAGAAATAATVAGAETSTSRPNILICIADDWGWPHASAYGDRVVKTPSFDPIAREGVWFTAPR